MKDGQTIGQWLNWDFEKDGALVIKDKNGGLIYLEELRYWAKREYNSKGNVTYYENSCGVIKDKRPKPSRELTLESLAEQVLNLSEIVTQFINKP